MNIFISAHGTKGDILPFVPIALELERRGHNVTFLVNEYFKEIIESYGFKMFSTGSTAQYIEFHSDQRIWDLAQDSTQIGFNKILRPTIESTFNFIKAQHSKNPDMLVIGIEPFFNGALMAAELLSIPHVYMFLWPHCVMSAIAPPAPLRWTIPKWFSHSMRAGFIKKILDNGRKYARTKDYYWELNGMRRYYGLAPIDNFATKQHFEKPNLQVGLFPSWYGMPVFDWPATLQLAGFPFPQETMPHKPDFDVETFIRKKGKPILFTSGTGVFDTKNIFEEGQKACDLLKVPGIFVGGDKHYKEKIASPYCMHVDYLDFDYSFPKCRAVVHHGGIGTLSKAIKHGIPQLIRPLAFDQPDNADRVRRLDLGDYILPKKFKSKIVAATLGRILNSDKIMTTVKHYASVINRGAPIENVCGLIEDYADNLEEKYKTPLQRSVEKYAENDPSNAIPDLPCAKPQSKKQLGNHEALHTVLLHFGRAPKAGLLYKRYPQALTLKNINDVIEDAGLTVRVFNCDMQYLPELKLPCLIQWQTARFVVLAGFEKDKAIIKDPLLKRQEYTLHELAWHYSDIAIEISTP